ncbi:MAG: hypothetical protein IKV29_01410 [Alistipes sp.]|nr:hypothetical protein [Alistipes sp.]
MKAATSGHDSVPTHRRSDEANSSLSSGITTVETAGKSINKMLSPPRESERCELAI